MHPTIDHSTLQQLFPGFEPALQNEIVDNCHQRSFAAGEALLKAGQSLRSTMLIVSGLVKVFRQDDDGNEYLMYYLQPGQACALSMACTLRQETSQVLAIAVGETEVISIPLANMDKWMLSYKSWNQFVLDTYRARFEELLQTLDHVAFRAMDERLEFYFRRYLETTGEKIVGISHQQIADELNSSREVISRLLKKMEQLGKIKLHRTAIEIIQL